MTKLVNKVFYVYDIDWDIDNWEEYSEECPDLPSEIDEFEIVVYDDDDHLAWEDQLVDKISDAYGWSIYSLNYDEICQ